MQTAVVTGPVAVAIYANATVFQNYKTGIINVSSCGTAVNAGVLVVGYGTSGTTLYYIVKFSYGTTWG